MGIFDKGTFDNIKQNDDFRWFFGLKKKSEIIKDDLETLEYVLDKYSKIWCWKVTGKYPASMISKLSPEAWYGETENEIMLKDTPETIKQLKLLMDSRPLDILSKSVWRRKISKMVANVSEDTPETVEWQKALFNKNRSKQGGLADIMEVLKQDFIPEPIKDEYDLENQLVLFLKLKFPDRTIRRKFRTEKNNEVDIMIDQLYGLELKVPENRTQLRNLGGQVEEYLEEYEIAIIIYEDESANISETIQEYVKKYKTKYDIDTIVYTGKIRK
jgi:hypothetical protein